MKREYPEHPVVAVGAVIIHEGRVLIVERGTAPRKGEWTVPGGVLELGETLRQGTEREAREETGLVVEAGEILEVVESIYPDSQGGAEYHYVLIDFLCRVISGEAEPQSDVSRVRWIRPEELGTMPLIGKTEQVIAKGFARCNPQGFVVRRAGERDAEGILACLGAAFEPYREFYSREAFQDTTLTGETVHSRLQNMKVFVAQDASGEVIGTIGCQVVDCEEGHLRGMAVRSAWQGRGVAEQLLRVAESELRARGCQRVTLDTTAPLKRAMRFYERNGYRPSGKVGDYHGMPLFEYVKALGSMSD
ncbi:MAG TPA: GNAT family N-acetyltransferase [Terriglobales bacterium]|nr:GNAT family N-acetyltransferase [Terriglobales bacterium]